MVVVREGQQAKVQVASGFTRVLVPVIGTVPNRLSQEIGASLCAHQDSKLWLLHVEPDREPALAVGGRDSGGRRTLAPRQSRGRLVQQQVLRDAEILARRLGAAPRLLTRQGDDPAQETLAAASELDADLVVLGTELRSERVE